MSFKKELNIIFIITATMKSSSDDRNNNEIIPYISVIITAHDRKQFLIDAIKSALNQTLEKSLYEILVVKNFEDEIIDDLIEKNGIISLKAKDDSLVGEDLALCIEKAKGEIISFLDDDDTFFTNKLEIVYHLFKDNDLIYFHNQQSFIDARGKIVNHKLPEIKKRFLLILPAGIKIIGRLISFYQDFNISSMCVRKEILIKNIDYLKDLPGSTDTYIFYQAAASKEGKMLFDPSVLTNFRIHDSSSQILTDNFSDYLKKAAEISKWPLEARNIIFKSLSKTSNKAVLRSCECYLTQSRVKYFLYNDNTKLSLMDQLRLLRCSFIQHYKYYVLLNIAASAVRLNKKWARNKIFQRNKNK